MMTKKMIFQVIAIKIKLTIARNLRNDISSSLLSLELMANLEVLIAFFDSADFKFDLILQHLNALDGEGDRTVFRCLFQRSATSRSFSFDCNKKKLFKPIQNKLKKKHIELRVRTYIGDIR